MPTFGFRLQFWTSTAQSMDTENESIVLKLPETERTIKLLPASKDSNNNWCNLIIQGSGYGSEDEAFKEGERIKNCILLSGPTLRMGFDIGKDKPRLQFAKAIKEEYKEKFGVQIIDDVHGLIVYSEDVPVAAISANITGIVSVPIRGFINNCIELYNNNYIISDKQSLALELYNLSHFDRSIRGRFLTLVTVIECLSVREERSDASIKFLEELIENTNRSNLGTNDKESLIKALESLRNESISRSCRKLIKRHLGKNGVKQFQIYYDIRGHILHDGDPPGGVDLGTEVNNLDSFVSDLLKANILVTM
jgi:hypothetical protein